MTDDVDWVFSGGELSTERRQDIERIKANVPSFWDLIEMDEAAVKKLGLKSEHVRTKLVGSIRNWLDKYRFPGTIACMA